MYKQFFLTNNSTSMIAKLNEQCFKDKSLVQGKKAFNIVCF